MCSDRSWAGHGDVVRRLLADEPVGRRDQPAVVGRLQRLCRVASRDLPAYGVGVSVVSDAGDVVTAAASSRASLRIEELQFSLGEGPCLTAIASRRPVAVPDLLGVSGALWPGYAPAAHDHGVRAVFAFPLQVGVSRLGALDVYRDTPGALSTWSTARAQAYADVATEAMLDAQQSGSSNLLADGETRFEVYQAQGMVMIQLGVAADEALSRIRAHAFADGRRMVEVAEDIIARRLVVEPDEPAPS